ncbi:MAG: NADPH-dependent FMN reductase [Xanthobacteraceae bacterium]
MAHNIAVIVGSLRKDAFSLKTARALAKLAPATLKLNIVTLEGLSFFNQDLEANPPADWVAFREKIQASDGVIIVTPEYNRSIPGVLKNALDIGSRPYGKSSFQGRPLGLFGTSPGAHGGVSAVKHLQQIMPGISGPIMQQPEAYAGMLGDAFDAHGEVTKDSLKQFVTAYIEAFAKWVEQQKK